MNDTNQDRAVIIQGELTGKDESGTETTIPVLLRDGGLAGIGAIYVGQQTPPSEGPLRLVTDTGASEEVRLVATKKKAAYVYLLGLEATARLAS